MLDFSIFSIVFCTLFDHFDHCIYWDVMGMGYCKVPLCNVTVYMQGIEKKMEIRAWMTERNCGEGSALMSICY